MALGFLFLGAALFPFVRLARGTWLEKPAGILAAIVWTVFVVVHLVQRAAPP